MSEQILVPVLGESITEATIAKWLKNVGDTVAHREQELFEDGVAVLVDSTIEGDPCAVDLIETNSDDMLKSHGCSGNQSEGSCDESL